MENYIELVLDGNRGVYIPQHFAEMIDVADWHGIDESELDILKSGPDHEQYWDAWQDVLVNAETRKTGATLHQDGDLFLIETEKAIADFNEMVEQHEEYETTHKDAGDNYAHMPREGFDEQRFRYSLKECGFDVESVDVDSLADIALDNFDMYAGNMFGFDGYSHGIQTDADFVVIDSFPVGEMEIQIPGQFLDVLEHIENSVDAYVSGDLAYKSTDAVWYAAIPAEKLRKLSLLAA